MQRKYSEPSSSAILYKSRSSSSPRQVCCLLRLVAASGWSPGGATQEPGCGVPVSAECRRWTHERSLDRWTHTVDMMRYWGGHGGHEETLRWTEWTVDTAWLPQWGQHTSPASWSEDRVRGEIEAGTGLLYRGDRGYQVDTAGVAGKIDDTREPRGRRVQNQQDCTLCPFYIFPLHIHWNISKNFSTELIYLILTPWMLHKIKNTFIFDSIQYWRCIWMGNSQHADTHTQAMRQWL